MDTVVPTNANIIGRPTGGMADAGRKNSPLGGVCCSIGDKSLGTSEEAINPFAFPHVMLMKVKTLKIELSKLKEKGLTVNIKKSKPQLQEQLHNA
jgi:hypothetical protein